MVPKFWQKDLQEPPNKLRLTLKLLMTSFFQNHYTLKKLLFSRAYGHQICIAGLLRYVNEVKINLKDIDDVML